MPTGFLCNPMPLLVSVLVAGAVIASPALAQSDDAQKRPTASATASKSSAATLPARKTSPYKTVKMTERGKTYYMAKWGVEKLKVNYTSSGNLIRFSYRVTDAESAKLLGDRKATPYLFGQRSRAMLQIPVMDKVGMLRQTGTPQVGQEYWMVFSNKGNLIKPGDRVNVMIGAFRADGLMVE